MVVMGEEVYNPKQEYLGLYIPALEADTTGFGGVDIVSLRSLSSSATMSELGVFCPVAGSEGMTPARRTIFACSIKYYTIDK